MLKPMAIQSVGIQTCEEAKIIADFSKLSILHHENELKKGSKYTCSLRVHTVTGYNIRLYF